MVRNVIVAIWQKNVYLEVVPVGGEFPFVEGPELRQVRVLGAQHPVLVPGHMRAVRVAVVVAVVLHAAVKVDGASTWRPALGPRPVGRVVSAKFFHTVGVAEGVQRMFTTTQAGRNHGDLQTKRVKDFDGYFLLTLHSMQKSVSTISGKNNVVTQLILHSSDVNLLKARRIGVSPCTFSTFLR